MKSPIVVSFLSACNYSRFVQLAVEHDTIGAVLSLLKS